MTTKQLEKINKLNKLHYVEMKLKSTYSIKNNDKKLGREFIAMIPENSLKNSEIKCKKEICDFYQNSVKNYITALNEYKKTRADIEKNINSINDEELAAILKYRYIEYLTWDEIADKMYCSLRSVKYKYKKALDKINI